MAGTKINQEIMNEEEMKMERANRVAVQAIESGYKADFYRTHKHVGTMTSVNTDWQADSTMNKTAQREDFRRFAIEHSHEIGIICDFTDRRDASNVRRPKYESDEDLVADVVTMMHEDIMKYLVKCPFPLAISNIDVDAITPMTHTSKGTDLAKLGIHNGKYESNSNWAWANIDVTITMEYLEEGEIYYSTTCQLASGQLKKPHITQTGINADIKQSLLEAGYIKEEEKVEKSTKSSKKAKAEEEEVIVVVVPDDLVAEESKPKKTRKSKKQEQAQA